MTYWAYLKEAAFGIFTRVLLTVLYLSYFKVRILSWVNKKAAGWVHSSWYHAFSIIFSLYLQGGREFTFPTAFCVSLKHWVVCCWESWSGHRFFSVLWDSTLFYICWTMRQDSRRISLGRALPGGLQDVPLALWSVVEGKEQELSNEETHVPDVALPLLWDLHFAEPHFPLSLKRMFLKMLPSLLSPTVPKMRMKIGLKCFQKVLDEYMFLWTWSSCWFSCIKY